MSLSTKNISVDIKNHKIIDSVSVEVNKGEFVGIIGPNGCGKSTFLKSIYRVVKPNYGTIYLDNIDIKKLSYKDTAKKMAVVSQFNEFNFNFNVEEIVSMGRTPYKKSFESNNLIDYQIVDSCLEKVNMKDYKKRMFSTLSGGEKQRVILARALAQNPKILILDEPTNHLDIKYQFQLLDIVKSINIQVFAALHDLNLALKYCDKVYVMKDGKIICKGNPKKVLTPKIIKEVFEVDAYIYNIPNTDKVNIIYL